MVEGQPNQERIQAHALQIDYLFLSGVLALDLVNTEVIVRGKRYDLFSSPDDVARWWQGVLVHYPDVKQVKAEKEEVEAIVWSPSLLENVKKIRTAVRMLSTNVVEQQPIDQQALMTLNTFLAMGNLALDVVTAQEMVKVYHTHDTEQGAILLPIALSALNLFTQAEKQRLHKCKNERCILFFYDTTKSATRHWCSLECMNRARSVQHYRQVKKLDVTNES